MRRTTRYVEQHARIKELARDLEEHLVARELAKDASAARRVLSLFSGKLSVHLAAEDRLLYPEVLHSPDPHVRALGERFMKDMAPISQSFRTYSVHWGSQGAIQSKPEEFIRETKKLLASIDERMRREERELYPLLDKT